MNVDECAVVVNRVLTEYIAIHNDVFRGSLRRVVPVPGIFQPIDFRSHVAALLNLASALASVPSALSHAPGGERGYADALAEYAARLYGAVTRLHDICLKQARVADGALRSYGAADYKRDVADYQSAVDAYVALGDALNAARREYLQESVGYTVERPDASEQMALELDRNDLSRDRVRPQATEGALDNTAEAGHPEIDSPEMADAESPVGEDPLEDRAERLVAAADIVAMTLTEPLLKRFPSFGDALDDGTGKWDFLITAAGVYVALMLLLEVSPEDYYRLGTIPFQSDRWQHREPRTGALGKIDRVINQKMETWYRRGERAVEDCGEFVTRSVEGVTDSKEQFATSATALGAWVLWNLYGHEPPESDDALASAVGGIIIGNFSTYWDEAQAAPETRPRRAGDEAAQELTSVAGSAPRIVFWVIVVVLGFYVMSLLL